MKILYCISNNGQGSGGHFHSLNQISNVLAKNNEVRIISIGTKPSPVIKSSDSFFKHIVLGSVLNLVAFREHVNILLNEFKPDSIHFFDTESLNYFLLVSSLKKYLVVMNKCGGPNPLRKKWQVVDKLVLFSKENYDFFASMAPKNRSFYLIPNRVREIPRNNYLNHPEKKTKDTITFLRVSRLGGAYEKTLLNTFNLMEELSSQFPVELIIVGRIQDEKRFIALKSNAEARKIKVRFITDKRAATGASFIYLADFVIGTGRSLMEGLSAGKPCLVPSSNYDTPVLLTENNFEGYFATNFSERGIATIEDIKNNLKNIKEVIVDEKKRTASSNFSKKRFDSFFNIESANVLYTKVYQKKKKHRAINLRLNNLLYLIKTLASLTVRAIK